MSNQSNVPMVPAGPEPFYQVWTRALTKPNEQTFAELAASPNAKAGTAYLWYFLAIVVQFFLASLVPSPNLEQVLQQIDPELASQIQTTGGFGQNLVGAICGAPIGGIIGTLFFAIWVFVVQWIARMFGGRGTTDQLAYATAAVAAPASLISGVVSLLSAIPYVGLCFGLLSFGFGIYVLVLEVMAVKGVNQFGWGPAIGSFLVPLIAVASLCACLVAGTIALLGPAISDAMQQVQ